MYTALSISIGKVERGEAGCASPEVTRMTDSPRMMSGMRVWACAALYVCMFVLKRAMMERWQKEAERTAAGCSWTGRRKLRET